MNNTSLDLGVNWTCISVEKYIFTYSKELGNYYGIRELQS
jgi:hypothetical protein